ncbi:hypothetical protein DI005_28075 [Prauserella sp. PE36]|uniref:Uncharacterized protein n=1 Tax=Prauserella endophytica TaxID=1592324 RepID=A0ABY2S7Q8_9PSEU|nr:hypothetical protein DI005_28075 [Prauserella sp. PE36]TKG71932.1 hypothetical protein FCN18_10630 [Prauserella endophytica]
MALLSRVTWREWLGLGAGLLALVTLFLPWTVLSADNPEVQAALSSLPGGDVSRSAWNSTFFAWFPPLLLLLAGLAVAAFGRVPSARTGGLPHLWLVASAVALVSFVLGWVLIDWQFGGEERALLAESGVSVDAGLGRWLAALAVLASLVAAILDLREARAESRRPRKLPRTR